MPAVLNILLALRQRDRTGQGCHLDIAMADAMPTFAWYGLAQGHATGTFPQGGQGLLTGQSPRYGLYATADGWFLAVGALELKFWRLCCEAWGRPVGVAVGPDGRSLLVADDVGNAVWRVSGA